MRDTRQKQPARSMLSGPQENPTRALTLTPFRDADTPSLTTAPTYTCPLPHATNPTHIMPCTVRCSSWPLMLAHKRNSRRHSCKGWPVGICTRVPDS